MPELPEVETIRLGLEKYLVGHKITNVDVKVPKLVTGNTLQVTGAKVIGIRRAGKGLIIDLDNAYSIAIHIKLTGQIIYRGPNAPKDIKLSKIKVGTLPNKATHVTFQLDKGGILYYNDFRQFGWIKIVKSDEVGKLPFFRELGPEPPVVPYSSRESFDFAQDKLRESRSSLPAGRQGRQARKVLTLDLFKEIVSRSKIAIKPLLMDQKRIGGIGNIYANEGLFVAKIDPRRPANSLTVKEQEILYKAIIDVMKKGFKERGASELAFVDALGQEGNYQSYFLVYGQEDQPCLNKNGLIRKIKLGGRGTYFCPACQH